jgi:hypothetical protein
VGVIVGSAEFVGCGVLARVGVSVALATSVGDGIGVLEIGVLVTVGSKTIAGVGSGVPVACKVGTATGPNVLVGDGTGVFVTVGSKSFSGVAKDVAVALNVLVGSGIGVVVAVGAGLNRVASGDCVSIGVIVTVTIAAIDCGVAVR